MQRGTACPTRVRKAAVPRPKTPGTFFFLVLSEQMRAHMCSCTHPTYENRWKKTSVHGGSMGGSEGDLQGIQVKNGGSWIFLSH